MREDRRPTEETVVGPEKRLLMLPSLSPPTDKSRKTRKSPRTDPGDATSVRAGER